MDGANHTALIQHRKYTVLHTPLLRAEAILAATMARKRPWRTATFRLDPDLFDELDRFVEAEGWTKTEALCVGLRMFFEASDKARLEGLLRFRKRSPGGAAASEKPKTPRGKPG